jgi:hypothetical protein
MSLLHPDIWKCNVVVLLHFLHFYKNSTFLRFYKFLSCLSNNFLLNPIISHKHMLHNCVIGWSYNYWVWYVILVFATYAYRYIIYVLFSYNYHCVVLCFECVSFYSKLMIELLGWNRIKDIDYGLVNLSSSGIQLPLAFGLYFEVQWQWNYLWFY